MKNLKKILVVVFVSLLVSCEKNTEEVPVDQNPLYQMFEFDHANNLVKINGKWVKAYDFENHKVSNDLFSVYSEDDGTIMVISFTYHFAFVAIEGLNVNVYNDLDNVLLESYAMDQFLQENEIINIYVQFEEVN